MFPLLSNDAPVVVNIFFSEGSSRDNSQKPLGVGRLIAVLPIFTLAANEGLIAPTKKINATAVTARMVVVLISNPSSTTLLRAISDAEAEFQ